MSDISQRLIGAYLALDYARLKTISRNVTIMDITEATHYARVAQTNISFYNEYAPNRLPILKSLANAIDNATSDTENLIYENKEVNIIKLAVAYSTIIDGFQKILKDAIIEVTHLQSTIK
jgi:hypothetical protein